MEEVVNRELSRLLQEDIHVIGASRTDSGVHALGNVAVFDTEARIPAEKVSFALNRSLTDADGEYEAKKQAYREKLMADDVTSDDLLIGSWVSFYSFETDSYEYQLDQMAAAGLNFNIFPKHFGSGGQTSKD